MSDKKRVEKQSSETIMRKNTKTKRLYIRMSESDYIFLKGQLQEDECLSAYCREHLLQTEDTRKKERERYWKELVYQIRKIGVNINQTVARMNAGVSFSDDGEMLKQELQRVYQLLEQFTEE